MSECYFGSLEFINAKEFPAVLKTIHELSEKEKNCDILLFSTSEDVQDISSDIQGYTGKPVSKIDINQEIYTQNLTDIILCVYNSKVPLHAMYSFFIESCDVDYATLKYLAKSSRKTSYIIYEEECDNITRQNMLENNDAEDNQNRG